MLVGLINQATVATYERPNFLWIVLKDLGPDIGPTVTPTPGPRIWTGSPPRELCSSWRSPTLAHAHQRD